MYFNPDPIVGRYNTSYKYDAAGNITRLNRYGLVDASAGQYTCGLIDSLIYTYANNDSRLSAIEDFVADPLASQPASHRSIAQRFFAVRIHLRRRKNP